MPTTFVIDGYNLMHAMGFLAGKVKPRFSGPFFNEFVAKVAAVNDLNKQLLKKKIIGGLPLGRFYPELSDSVLLCSTEMTKRADMDAVANAILRSVPATEVTA